VLMAGQEETIVTKKLSQTMDQEELLKKMKIEIEKMKLSSRPQQKEINNLSREIERLEAKAGERQGKL